MPSKSLNMQKILAVCQRHADHLGYELCDAAMEKEPAGRYLRIYIDTDTGVTLDDCEKYHRAVQPDLEFVDYDFLEVCSPGIDRPLKTPRDIQKNMGNQVEVRLYRPVDGLKTAQGALLRMDGEAVEIQSGDGRTLQFPRSAVSQVRLAPDLSALDEEESSES